MSEVGGPKLGLMNIGEEAKPPFAVLPDPVSIFLTRSKRFAALAPGHELQPYLEFLAKLTRAQHDIQDELPAAALPPFDRIGQALEHGMPPLSRALYEPDPSMELTVERLLSRLASIELPQATALAISAVRQAPSDQRRAMLAAALKDATPPDDVAQRTLVLAGLQVYFARLAALLRADDLKPVADGVCPTCGSAPVSSTVVGWPKAHNTRFCTCSLCATMWNVVRVKCVLCSSTEGISYKSIEGGSEHIKAETCDKCRRYVKIFYQVNDPVLEGLADDVASLGLDMMLTGEAWTRGAQNPFLLGY
ncbi:MAG: formate dehydrogenase accessory protein FdhE [Hyphomicrobiaceae bacterium]